MFPDNLNLFFLDIIDGMGDFMIVEMGTRFKVDRVYTSEKRPTGKFLSLYSCRKNVQFVSYNSS